MIVRITRHQCIQRDRLD